MEEESWTERRKRHSEISKALENDEMQMIFDYYQSRRGSKRDLEPERPRSRIVGEDETTLDMISPNDETSKKYKQRLKFLKSVNPIGEKERDLFYTPLSKSLSYPFEEDIQNILGEDHYKYASRILDTVDKSFLSGWMFTKYLEEEFGLKNFDSSIPNIDPILKFIKYIYSRIGNPEQYYKKKKIKLDILLRLIKKEEEDLFKTESEKRGYSKYEISLGNLPASNKAVIIYFEPNGMLYLEDGTSIDTIEESSLRKIGGIFHVFVKKSDQNNIDMSLFNFLPFYTLMEDLSKKYIRTGEFVFTILETLVSNIAFIKKLNDKYIYPFDHSTIQNTKRFFIIPISLPMHLNILIIDNKMKTIERFEPHGSYDYTSFANFLKRSDSKKMLTKAGFGGLLTQLEKASYKFSDFYDSKDFVSMLNYILEVEKNKKQFVPLRLSVEQILLDIDLLHKKFPDKFSGYKILLPIDYEIENGIQRYYDVPLETEIPIGLCVTFCYLYFIMRSQDNTEEDFMILQRDINQQLFDLMKFWYTKNVGEVKIDERNEKEKKIFVQQAIVEFIVKVTDTYLGKLTETINKMFDIHTHIVRSRSIKIY